MTAISSPSIQLNVAAIQPHASPQNKDITVQPEQAIRAVVTYADYALTLDLHGGSYRRSPIRTSSKRTLHKWLQSPGKVMIKCTGLNLFQGFDDMPLVCMPIGDENPPPEQQQPVRVAAAGKLFAVS